MTSPLSHLVNKKKNKNPEEKSLEVDEVNLSKYRIPISFGILSPTANSGYVERSIGAIRSNYDGCKVICSTTKSQKKYIKSNCDIVSGQDSITNLINAIFEQGDLYESWMIVMMEGCLVGPNLDKRYSTWAKSDRDVLFPIVTERNHKGYATSIYSDFHNCTMNGIAIHTKAFRDVGKFGNGPIDVVKKEWWLSAIQKGINFKAILNCPIDR